MKRQLTAALVFSLLTVNPAPVSEAKGTRDAIGEKLKFLKKAAKDQDWYANVMLFAVGFMMPVYFNH